jgi:hypothetical protein
MGVPQVIIQNWLSMGKTMVWGTHSFGNLHITWFIIGICGGFVTFWRLSPNLYQGVDHWVYHIYDPNV